MTTLFAVQVDTSVNVVSLILGSGILFTLGRVVKYMLDFRDETRDLRRIVGHEDPPKGPSGLILNLRELDLAVGAHREFLLKQGFERRHSDRRYTGYGRDMREEG